MTSQPRASLANARNVPRQFDRRLAVVLARRHAITTLTWTRPAGDHRQWQWLPDGLVSILQFRYGLNAVHVDSRRAHVHRANFFDRGRHGQESKEGKEYREGSHQEGGKEDFQEKEVISSTTNRLPPPGAPRQARPLQRI
jgi:hypothetical protein